MVYAVRYNTEGLTRQADVKKQKIISRRLVKEAIFRETGKQPDFSNLVFGPHGKPRFSDLDIHYNITNCRGLVLCAVGKTEVGIDAETIRPVKQRLIERVCTRAEQEVINEAKDRELEFIKFWTLKEGYLKYTGDGLGFGAVNAEFTYKGRQPHKVDDTVKIWQLVHTIAGVKFVISIFSDDNAVFKIDMLEEKI